MGLNGGSMGLGFVLWAQDLASHVLKNVEHHVKSLDATTATGAAHIAGSFRQIATAAGVLTAGLAPLGAVVTSAFAAGDFVQGLAAAGAATGATAKEMRGLHDAALAAGIATQFSPNEAVQGLIALATAGQTATQAMGTLKQSLDLAAASLGQLTVSQASDALGGTLTAWSMSTDKATEVTDKLVQATMLTNFQASDFAVGLSRVAEAGARYNQSLDDVLIGMGLLRNRNINAEVAATALRAAITRVNSDLNAQKLLMQHHIPLLDAYTGKERSILDILTEFAAATRGLSPLRLNAMVKDIFGEEGMPAFSSAASAMFTAVEDGISTTYHGVEAIAALRRELANAGGAAAKFVERYNDNFKGQTVLLRGSVSALFVTIGEVFGKLLTPAVTFVTAQLNRLLALIMAVPMPLKEAAGEAMLLAGGLLAVAGATALASRSFGLMRLAVVSMRSAVVPMLAGLASLTATPVGAAVAAAAGALALLYVAYRRNVGRMATLTGSGPGSHILAFWRGLSQLLSDGALHGDVLHALSASPALKRFTVGVFAAVDAVARFGRGIKDGFSGALAVFSGTFTRLGTSLGSLGNGAMQLFGALGRLLRVVALVAGPVVHLLGGAVGAILGTLAAALSLLATGLANLITCVVTFANVLLFCEDIWGPVFQSVANCIDNIGRALTSLWDMAGMRKFCQAIVRMLPNAFKHALRSTREFLRDIFGHPFGDGALYTAPNSIPSPAAESPAAAESARAIPAEVFPNPGDTPSRYPAVVETHERTRQITQTVANQTPMAARQASPSPSPPISVAVQIDGETIARAVARAEAQQAARQFAPLGTY